MKTLKTILFSLLALVIVVVIAGLLFVTGIKHGAIPQYKGELIATGLGSEVTV